MDDLEMESQESFEAPEDLEELRRKQLDDYGAALEKDKNDAVEWRNQHADKRWVDAERQLRDGITYLTPVKELGGSAGIGDDRPSHQRAVDNITAPLTKIVYARISNMMFGTDESQADIVPSPIPTASPLTQINPDDPNKASLLAEEADKAAAKMELTIKDRLAECDYAKQGRIAIADACNVGTGVLHGPFPKIVNHKVSNTIQDESGNPVTVFVYKQKIVPFVERIDYRRFYPKPCRNMKECDGVFLLDLMTKKKVKELVAQGFDHEQVERLVKMEPDAGILNETPTISQSGKLSAVLKDKYPVWKYVGEINTKTIASLHPDTYGEGEEVPDTVTGEVWFCQGITLKAVPTDDEILPFHVFNYRPDPESVFGYGVSHDIANDQHDRNLAWSTVKLNAMAAAYPIIGVLKGTFESENGVIDLPLKKPIILNGDKVGNCIDIQTVPSTIRDSLLIYEQALQNAKDRLMIQSLEQTAPANVQVGAAMFAMLKTEENIIQSEAAKNWDDNITKPLLTAFINFELLHGDDPECKGVFDVIPKAASHLLTKDITAQQALQVINLAMNPNNAPFYKMYELNRLVIEQTNLNADKIMNTKDEVAALQEQAQQQPNPDMMKAEAEKYKVDKQFESAQLQAQIDLEIANIRSQTESLTSRMSLEAASIKAASDETMTKEELETRHRIAALSSEAKTFSESLKDARERAKTAAKTTLEAERITQSGVKVQAQIESERPLRL